MRLEVADGFTQLALHVLAHVPRTGPGDLFDPRHVEASARWLGPRAQARLVEDAAVLATLWRSNPALDVLDALPMLHDSLPGLRRTAARALAEVRADEVAVPALLRALQGLGPAGELCHACLGLLADEFVGVLVALEPTLRGGLEEMRAWINALAAHVPGLEQARIEVVWSLAARGRAMPGRILVGCAGHLVDAATPAIVAAHEHAVCSAGQFGHVRAECSALVRLAGRLASAPVDLREAHARWLASLDLDALLSAAVDAGLLARADALEIQRARDDRPALLARLGR